MNQQRTNGAAIDAEMARRPGVPMETDPQPIGNAHWQRPARMEPRPGIVHRAQLDELTPVFGTAQPLAGLSGLIRRVGYAIPEHKVRHWMLLLLADRVDVLEHRVKRALPFVGSLAALGIGAMLLARRR